MFADRERVHQVLFNLLDNAVRFTPLGGRVTVTASSHNGSVDVVVADTGPGISSEHLPRVFERFYRVDQSRSRDDGGTGIGLAIARSVVEAHGGGSGPTASRVGGARSRSSCRSRPHAGAPTLGGPPATTETRRNG